MSGAAVKRERRILCAGCHGSGQRWTCDERDGFEKNRRWETCWDCGGDGDLPEKRDEEE